MNEIRTEQLFQLSIQVPADQMQDIGDTPAGHRTIVKITGGEFDGPRIRGRVIEGDDWLLLRPDGVMQLDCRMTLETDDGHMICMTYRGLRHGPQEVMDRIGRGEEVDASEYYHRVTPYFETASEKYGWLNAAVCVAAGHKRPWGGAYSVHQVL
jgi:hypothetical protein